MAFNEDSRVKIPALLHLYRLGYEYASLKDHEWNIETNIFPEIFSESLKRINPNVEDLDPDKVLEDISIKLDNEDLGEEFYKMLTSTSGTKLIDFKNFENNSFHICTELTCKNGDDEFRPDITILINGMPLAFIEVKKPNNRDGILAERERINIRFQNKKFRKFVNITQLLIFTNNMEYDDESSEPIQGAFYSTTSTNKAIFNYFREEKDIQATIELRDVDEEMENFVLSDNNLNVIKHSPEFNTNKSPNTPTNRLFTSMLSKQRIKMLLQYSIAYVHATDGIQKHIMRYPQLFATMAIEEKLEKGENHGIIWHTQGSGKTALAYYNVNYLTDYYQHKGIVPRFYFIVDRLDLLKQAKREFSARGLVVHTVNSKDELLNDFKIGKAISNLSGEKEITVVNIQKFKDDGDILHQKDYDINIQRIYFLDEVHRSYDPKGSFLANLFSSDRDAVIIGLTGTPLIGASKSSKQIFGDYIHKYYYNLSIRDGYTLKLIREGIETGYKIKLQEALKEIEILKGNVDKREVYSHKTFVNPMIDYILDDLQTSRIRLGDGTIGAMVVCDSSDQAKMLSELFDERMQNLPEDKRLKSALILHDVGSKEERDDQTEAFKDGDIDILFVFNMLLTGFDAKRLKKLFIARVIRKHNLLQTLTRVNRPYKNFKYGYVVDFADIRQEFEKTNQEYFHELQNELGDEMDKYSDLFKSQDEINSEISYIKEKLFEYDITNSEIFSQQISQIEDRKTVLEIKKALEGARDLYNIIRLQGDYDLLDKLDFKRLGELLNEVSRHLELLNLKENIEQNVENTNLLNAALEDVLFTFKKVSEDELIIADQLKSILKKTRETMGVNIDKNDPEFILLYDELKRLFKKKNLDEISQEEMTKNIGELNDIYNKIVTLNQKNERLKEKYKGDAKFVRIHKRIREKGTISDNASHLHEVLMKVKQDADEKVVKNMYILNNDGYFNKLMTQTVVNDFQKSSIELNPESAMFVSNTVTDQYLNEFNGYA
jgi:type I restriction enzyme R subunit